MTAIPSQASLASEMRVSVMRLARRLRRERESEGELGMAAISVLGVLFRGGECTIGELAAHERVRPPSMTRTVACLVEEGYVERRPHESDRRQVLVDLTARGRATVAADRERRTAWLAQRISELSPEERAVLRAAAPVIERLASQ